MIWADVLGGAVGVLSLASIAALWRWCDVLGDGNVGADPTPHPLAAWRDVE